MVGISGTFAINGVDLTLQPSTSKWLGRDYLGTDGNNRAIYPTIREYEMGWDLMPVGDLAQLINAQLSSVTGTLVMDLPQWGASTYTFKSYSGTSAREPEVDEYFVDHVSGIRWLISNIGTN